jgi:putative RNA 2'-phosphotransferase
MSTNSGGVCTPQLRITLDELREVVAKNNKQRFGWSADGTRIRANQGHSVSVNLQLPAQTPPDVLYHGTASQNLETILREGLRPMRRHHVHLSRDVETARTVGARHGKPVVLEVDAASMHFSGLQFLQSENGVWLTDHVPPQNVRVLD